MTQYVSISGQLAMVWHYTIVLTSHCLPFIIVSCYGTALL